MRTSYLLAAGTAAFVLILTACSDRPSDSPEATSTPESTKPANSGLLRRAGAGPAVQLAAKKSTDASSVAFVVEGAAQYFGETSPLRGSGSIDFARDRSAVTWIADGETTEMVADGDTIYTHYEDDGLWLKEDAGEDSGALPLFDRMDPTELLEKLTELSETVTDEGDEEIRGKVTRHYSLEIDYLKAFPPEDEIIEEMFSEDPEFSVDLWIAGDGLPARISYKLSFEMSFGLGSDDEDSSLFEISLTYDFSDWGKAVTIEIPDPSEVDPDSDFDLTDLADIPETTWPSSVACGSGDQLEACKKATPSLLTGSDCSAPGLRLCLQPVGAVPEAQLHALVEHFRTTYAVRIEVLPAIDMPPAAMAERKTQASTHALMTALGDKYMHLDPDLDAAFMVITPIDVWQESHPEWDWVFGSASQDTQDTVNYRWSVFSTFRMNPATYGEPSDSAKWEKRVRTFMTKYVGITYFHFPMSDNPKSPLYKSITGLSILDGITLGLPPVETAPRR